MKVPILRVMIKELLALDKDLFPKIHSFFNIPTSSGNYFVYSDLALRNSGMYDKVVPENLKFQRVTVFYGIGIDLSPDIFPSDIEYVGRHGLKVFFYTPEQLKSIGGDIIKTEEGDVLLLDLNMKGVKKNG